MARALIFSDGFDVYTSITQMWDSAGADNLIDNTGTLSRSGLGCLVIRSAGQGPTKVFGTQTNVIISGALNPSGADPSGSISGIFQLRSASQGVSQVGMFYRGSLSVGVCQNTTVSGSVLAESATNVMRLNTYNFFTMMVSISRTVGICKLWVNGVKVLDVTGLNTSPATLATVDSGILEVQGGLVQGLWDDVTIWSWTDVVADEFPFMPSCLPYMPVADRTPLQWLPAVANSPHFAMVNAVPASITNYVFDSGTPGDTDQYIHQIPANQIKPVIANQPTVLAINHKMYAQLDSAGARSIASNKNGVQGPTSFPLTTSPLFYNQPYTPGLASINQITTTPFGPEVTA
jgi:hypothetical protein